MQQRHAKGEFLACNRAGTHDGRLGHICFDARAHGDIVLGNLEAAREDGSGEMVEKVRGIAFVVRLAPTARGEEM